MQQWIHELRERYLNAALVALGEIIALQHLRHGFMAQQFDGITQIELVKPLALPAHLGQVAINNAKKLLEGHADLLALGPTALVRNLAAVPESIRTGIRNNAGGHVNHSFFWPLLAPGGGALAGALSDGIVKAFGSVDDFKKAFADAAMKRFGSGWAWLSLKPDGSPVIHSTANQDSPLSDGLSPVLGLDVWEHAYYLHYQNRRADYVAAFWNVVNWGQAGANYSARQKV